MPHLILKLTAGRSDATKARIAAELTKTIMATADCPESAVSIDIQDIPLDRWTTDVYAPDIAPHLPRLHKQPGY